MKDCDCVGGQTDKQDQDDRTAQPCWGLRISKYLRLAPVGSRERIWDFHYVINSSMTFLNSMQAKQDT